MSLVRVSQVLALRLKVADKGKVCVVTKDKVDETATKYAQGGIATVMYPPDTHEKHIKDTLDCRG